MEPESTPHIPSDAASAPSPDAQRWTEHLAPELYAALKSLARDQLRHEADGHTLGTTALVHEAWLRLSASHNLPLDDRPRFFAMAATTMRRILVDHARKVRAEKRGGGAVAVSLEFVDAMLTNEQADELVALDDALARLAIVDARAARVVEMRFFGGLTEAETARALDISPKTVQRDWRVARAWLWKEVARDLGILGELDGQE
ncbi:MAG: sigma-70 family RNA polymerase sigma factor [Gemmatimonadaceae bacterium]|nr:sigma-70 family RNA polymerase sigma factor [Gemmatimonadaceae bacterium]